MIPDTEETDKPVAVEVNDTGAQAYQEADVRVQRGRVPRHEEAKRNVIVFETNPVAKGGDFLKSCCSNLKNTA